ncbi:MAG: YccF domain-containing protein [Propionibacteriaceae bacterium]
MKTIINAIWFLLAGVWLWLGYMLAGVLACIFVVTIPFGIASFRLANYVVWPFGRTVVARPSAGVHTALANVVWFVIAGWWLVLLHLVIALGQALTIVGLANAWVSLKMIPVCLAPFGKQIVSTRSVYYR